MTYQLLPAQIDKATACKLAASYCPKGRLLADAHLSHFPLLGLSFRLHGQIGAARSLDGNNFGLVVDLVSGTPLLAPTVMLAVTHVSEVPAGIIAIADLNFRIDREAAIQAARQTLGAKLMSKLRLGSQFSLELTEEIWPLWKPNWIISTTDNSLRFLIDGLNGNVVSQQQ